MNKEIKELMQDHAKFNAVVKDFTERHHSEMERSLILELFRKDMVEMYRSNDMDKITVTTEFNIRYKHIEEAYQDGLNHGRNEVITEVLARLGSDQFSALTGPFPLWFESYIDGFKKKMKELRDE